MQQIAREFNFSETAFVFPAENGHTRRVRIFTPEREIPFAGHPNVGTAFVLASTGELGEIHSSLEVTFEEKAGLVPVAIRETHGEIAACELSAPEPLSLGESVAVPLVAGAVSLSAEDIVTDTHPPQVASVGLPFLFVELANRAALSRARGNVAGCEAIDKRGVRPSIYVYARGGADADPRSHVRAAEWHPGGSGHWKRGLRRGRATGSPSQGSE